MTVPVVWPTERPCAAEGADPQRPSSGRDSLEKPQTPVKIGEFPESSRGFQAAKGLWNPNIGQRPSVGKRRGPRFLSDDYRRIPE